MTPSVVRGPLVEALVGGTEPRTTDHGSRTRGKPTMLDDFASAVQHHLNGGLDQAAKIYQAILARDPHHVDALHLLGVVAYQQGNPQQACTLIGQAIALQPSVASYYANLAEVYRATGQLERAIACCRSALALQPDFP